MWKSQLLPCNWEQKCLAVLPTPLHQHQTLCHNNWLWRVWVSSWKTLSLPTASCTQHSSESTAHTGTAEVKSPDHFFNQQFGPVYYWAGSGPVFPKVGNCYLKYFGTEEGAGRQSVDKPLCPFSKNSADQVLPCHMSQSRSYLLLVKVWGPWKSKCFAAIYDLSEMSCVRAFIILT